jgi:long-chain acyl-CoA synthetase
VPRPQANLAAILTRAASAHPDLPALRLDDAALTFAELDAASARVADHLRRRGVDPGSRVGLMLPNVPEFGVLYYGILRAGGVVVPMNPLLKSREIAYHLSDAQAGGLLAWPGVTAEAAAGAALAGVPHLPVDPAAFAAELADCRTAPELAPREPSDTAVILYTSGTTGRPKGAELTHDNLARNAEVSVRTLLRTKPGDVVFGGLPLFHSFGQTAGLNCAVAAGACLSLVSRFEAAKTLEVLARDGVRVFLGVPTMYVALLALARQEREGFDTSALRLCVSGGAPLPVEVLHAFERAFDTVVLEGYGLSETSPVACFNHPDRARRPGTIGTPIEGVRMRVLDPDGHEVPDGRVGEIAVQGHNVMKGYWGRPDATLGVIRDGWLHTGDMGVRDEDGYFRIVDRKKDMIIRGGYNVYPREIEEVLYEHPDVAEAAVLGVPHPVHGEEVAAAVALRPGATATADELREHVKALVAPYKYPRQVWILDALPKGPTGKILKRAIRPPAGLAR